jgi:phosphatidylglycerophosphate synthase
MTQPRKEPGQVERNYGQWIAWKIDLANLLTIVRFPLTLASIPSFLEPVGSRMPEWWWGFGLIDISTDWGRFWFGGIMFIVGALCDLFDGLIARWAKSQSAFGQFGDPLADKLMNWTIFGVASVQFFPPTWLWLPLWYLPLWEMLKLDILSTKKHWLNYRRASRDGVVYESHGAKWQGKIKLWMQVIAISVCLAALCPPAPDNAGILGKVSDGLILGLLGRLQPGAWVFVFAALGFAMWSIRVRTQKRPKPGRFADAVTEMD